MNVEGPWLVDSVFLARSARLRRWMPTAARVLAVIAALAAGWAGLHAQASAPAPLSIARQGYLFAGGTYSVVNGRRVLSGQLYAEFQIPAASGASR